MAERLGLLVLTFLLGYAALWLGWGWTRRPFSRRQVARAVVLFGAGTIVALLFVETVGLAVDPSWGPCSPCACPAPPPLTAFTGFGIW
jgi:hypothetical protein